MMICSLVPRHHLGIPSVDSASMFDATTPNKVHNIISPRLTPAKLGLFHCVLPRGTRGEAQWK